MKCEDTEVLKKQVILGWFISFRQGGVIGCQKTPSAEVWSSFSPHLILKMIATSGFQTALESTKFILPRWRCLQHSPDRLAGLRGPYF